MSGSQTLTLFPTSLSVVLSALVVVVVAGLGYIAWRRSGYRRAIGMLELFRVAIVVVIAVLLNQPEWVERFRPDKKRVVAVLYDASRSMQTRDVVDRQRPKVAPRTRAAAAAPLVAIQPEPAVRQHLEIASQPFAEPREGHGTDLNAALVEAIEKHGTLRGIVLASDGDWNEGRPPVEAAGRLRLKNIPVYAMPLGSPSRLPDVELVSLDLPTFGVVGKSVRIAFAIDNWLPRDYVTTVKLETSSGEKLTKDVRIAAMGRTNDWILWKPELAGDYQLSLDVPVHRDELIPDNNTQSAPIAVRAERLRVLVVESYPRWEYRYLRNALSRDPGVELSCLLFHPGLSKVGGGNKDYIAQFPDRLEELAAYDVVFLGDVGVGDGQLTAEQCHLLKGLVGQQASGLVFIPGWQGRQATLLETELSDLYPVVIDPVQPNGWGSQTADHFELTEAGRRSLLTKLADTQDENSAIWEDLPGFQWYAAVVRAKAAAEVLCVHKSATNEYGRIPLLVTRTYGTGKVLFMGTDGAWRWRKGVEDKYHYRFWGQVVRWMAYQRNMAKGKTVRLYFQPDQPAARSTLTLHANIMTASGEPVEDDDVAAKIASPSGKVDSVRFTHEGDEWGLFTGQYTPVEAGQHRISLSGQRSGASLDSTFFVQGAAIERVGHPARPEVLEELARITGGKVIEPADLGGVLRSLATQEEPAIESRRLQLWSNPWLASFVLLLMSAFWVFRKMVGLV